MNFTISKTTFYNSLSLVSKAISSTSPLPALTGIKIDILEDRLILTGASSEFSIRHEILVEHEINQLKIYETGNILMDARNLLEIVRKLDSNSLTMETVDGLMVRITGNLAIFTLNSMVVDSYPKIDFSKPKTQLVLDRHLLADMIRQTSFASSDRLTRPVLMGVNFSYDKHYLTAVATDSFRLARKQVPFESDIDPFNITIPKKALDEVVRLLEGDGELSIAMDTKKIQFENESILIQSQLLDDVFPETNRLIPINFVNEIIMNTNDLKSAIGRAIFIRMDGTSTVRMDIQEDNVLLTSQSQEIGSSKETLMVNHFEGEPLRLSFSGKFMDEALRSINSSDVLIKFSGELKPFLILNPQDETLLQLILPVRTFD